MTLICRFRYLPACMSALLKKLNFFARINFDSDHLGTKKTCLLKWKLAVSFKPITLRLRGKSANHCIHKITTTG